MPTGPVELPLAGRSGSCGCGHTPEEPVLDARSIPHAVRHGSIFGALDSVSAGGSMVLVAPHDPLPLLAQAQERYGDAYVVEYIERGPAEWRLRFRRTR
jgi:uncharacterized protein (DUF2249 family)